MALSIRDDDGVSNPSSNRHLDAVIDRAAALAPNRRHLLKSGLGLARPALPRWPGRLRWR